MIIPTFFGIFKQSEVPLIFSWWLKSQLCLPANHIWLEGNQQKTQICALSKFGLGHAAHTHTHPHIYPWFSDGKPIIRMVYPIKIRHFYQAGCGNMIWDKPDNDPRGTHENCKTRVTRDSAKLGGYSAWHKKNIFFFQRIMGTSIRANPGNMAATGPSCSGQRRDLQLAGAQNVWVFHELETSTRPRGFSIGDFPWEYSRTGWDTNLWSFNIAKMWGKLLC